MADQQKDKRTASQRIEDLERTIMALYQTADNMARDLMTMKEAIKLLGNKAEAIAKASNISDDTISALMVENNVAELKSKVDNLVEQAILAPATELGDSSFVVGQEVDQEGKIVNPRIQFSLASLNPDLQAKIKAGKLGEPIVLQEGKLSFVITEIYSIQAPAPKEAPVADAAPSEPQAPALTAVPDAAPAAAPTVATEVAAGPVNYAPPVAMPADATPAAPQSSSDATATSTAPTANS